MSISPSSPSGTTAPSSTRKRSRVPRARLVFGFDYLPSTLLAKRKLSDTSPDTGYTNDSNEAFQLSFTLQKTLIKETSLPPSVSTFVSVLGSSGVCVVIARRGRLEKSPEMTALIEKIKGIMVAAGAIDENETPKWYIEDLE